MKSIYFTIAELYEFVVSNECYMSIEDELQRITTITFNTDSGFDLYTIYFTDFVFRVIDNDKWEYNGYGIVKDPYRYRIFVR